jgi:hypothetical protein
MEQKKLEAAEKLQLVRKHFSDEELIEEIFLLLTEADISNILDKICEGFSTQDLNRYMDIIIDTHDIIGMEEEEEEEKEKEDEEDEKNCQD